MDECYSMSNSIYQVFLYNIGNSHTAVWFKIIIITLSKWLNNSIWSIIGSIIGTTNLGLSEPVMAIKGYSEFSKALMNL